MGVISDIHRVLCVRADPVNVLQKDDWLSHVSTSQNKFAIEKELHFNIFSLFINKETSLKKEIISVAREILQELFPKRQIEIIKARHSVLL